jgi:hemoglobin
VRRGRPRGLIAANAIAQDPTMTTTVTEPQALTPYDVAGGGERVRAFVDRFYDLMDTDPAYAELRALHASGLGPMRVSLAGFLSAWLGGPRDWFDQRPGVCMMSAHAKVRVDAETARQWAEAMARALADNGVEAALRERINEAFARMAQGMAAR